MKNCIVLYDTNPARLAERVSQAEGYRMVSAYSIQTSGMPQAPDGERRKKSRPLDLHNVHLVWMEKAA